MDLKEIGWKVTAWIDLVQDRETRRAIVNPVMSVYFRLPPGRRGELWSSGLLRSE